MLLCSWQQHITHCDHGAESGGGRGGVVMTELYHLLLTAQGSPSLSVFVCFETGSRWVALAGLEPTM